MAYAAQEFVLPSENVLRYTLNPNRSLDRYSAVRYGEDNFLSSFISLLAYCFSLGLAVARYAFELTANNLLNNLMKSVQDLMTDWGKKKTSLRIHFHILRIFYQLYTKNKKLTK